MARIATPAEQLAHYKTVVAGRLEDIQRSMDQVGVVQIRNGHWSANVEAQIEHLATLATQVSRASRAVRRIEWEAGCREVGK